MPWAEMLAQPSALASLRGKDQTSLSPHLPICYNRIHVIEKLLGMQMQTCMLLGVCLKKGYDLNLAQA